MVIKTEICGFSGCKIFPGHGYNYIRNDGKNLFFLNSKCRRYYLGKIKAIKVKWTLIYRKIKKKKI
ncbi:60S ribosomal protein L24 (nucleomorph) [Chroomonas mesostigmatica CCMP1168]|uniref:60S ribosomal protein L24 n=1 Tax=Chroomonas mesostigmatica CCMP1168 TaxID=1195612 RepID=J7G1Y7_9CRYP|nr:60S ribosomal protein L24 [Chroomonas mesostigmatica CCMP1168]